MSRMKSRCKVLCTSRVYVVRSRYFYCICGGPCKAMRGAIPVSGRLNPTVSHVSHKTWGNNISFHWRKPVFCTHFIVKEDGGEKGQIVLFFPARYMTQKKPSFRCGTERTIKKNDLLSFWRIFESPLNKHQRSFRIRATIHWLLFNHERRIFEKQTSITSRVRTYVAVGSQIKVCITR